MKLGYIKKIKDRWIVTILYDIVHMIDSRTNYNRYYTWKFDTYEEARARLKYINKFYRALTYK
jgi:hypothetical protein